MVGAFCAPEAADAILFDLARGGAPRAASASLVAPPLVTLSLADWAPALGVPAALGPGARAWRARLAFLSGPVPPGDARDIASASTGSRPFLPQRESQTIVGSVNAVVHQVEDGVSDPAAAARSVVRDVTSAEDEVKHELVVDAREMKHEVGGAEKSFESDMAANAQKSSLYLDRLHCFPGDARAYVKGRGPAVPLCELAVGDRVLCGSGPFGAGPDLCFAAFLGYLHVDEEATASRFLAVQLQRQPHRACHLGAPRSADSSEVFSPRVLRLTSDHLVFARRGVDKADGDASSLGQDYAAATMRAGQLRPGDRLFALGVDGCLEPTEVAAVASKSQAVQRSGSKSWRYEDVVGGASGDASSHVLNGDSGGELATGEDYQCGAFAPLTETGSIVVDGVLCSSYADVVDWGPGFHEVAHRALGRPLSRLAAEPSSLSVDLDTRTGGAALHPAAEALLAVFRFLPVAAWKRLLIFTGACPASRPEAMSAGSCGGHTVVSNPASASGRRGRGAPLEALALRLAAAAAG